MSDYPTAEDKAGFAGLPLAGHPDPWEETFDIGNGEKGLVTGVWQQPGFYIIAFDFKAWYWEGTLFAVVFPDRVAVTSPDEPSRTWRSINFEDDLRKVIQTYKENPNAFGETRTPFPH